MQLNGMKPSTRDTIELVKAMVTRWNDLCGAFARMKGEPLALTDDVTKSHALFKQVFERHMRGDLRNTAGELKAIREFAQWMCDVNSVLRNQVPQKLEWSDG
jgi:hypothetical protein